MNSNRTFSHVFNFQTERRDVYYYVTANISILTILLLHMCAIFRRPNKMKICLTKNSDNSSAA